MVDPPGLETGIVNVTSQVSDELQNSGENLTSSFTTRPVGFSILRKADGCFIAVNDVFLAMCGYPREEVIGRTFEQLQLDTYLTFMFECS